MTSTRRFFIVLIALVLLPVTAIAATTEFRVLIDSDNNTATGCTLGGMSGVEHVLVTLVRTDATSGEVVRSYRLTCVGGAAFGSPTDVDESGWPVGFNPATGGMTVENRLAWSVLTPSGMPTGLRLGFDASTGASVHSAVAHANGASIIYPPKAGKRHAVGVGPQARTFQLDGSPEDWGAITPLVNGIASGGNRTIRIIQVFAFANSTDEFLYFRFDANVSSDAPFAEDDNYNRPPGEGLTVPAPGVLANDGDPNGQPLTAMPVSPATHGDVTLNADGSFTYAPNDPGSTQTDTFEYKATNGAQDSNVAKVTIKVSAVANHAPAPQDDNASTDEDTQLNVPAPGVLGNDADGDSDPLTATKLTDPSHGTVVVNADGSFTYTPDANFFGTDSFSYTVSDGTDTATATVTVTITSVNDAPTVDATTFSVDENAPAGTGVGTVTGSDIDGDAIGFTITGGNTNDAFAISSSGVITVANSAALDFETTPTFSLTVTATDNGVPAANGSATITITLGDLNEAPVATDDAGTVAEDGTLSVPAPGVLSNDTDQDGDTLTAARISDPLNGVATVAANGAWTYTPNANFNGTDSFTYQVTDGAHTATATVTITVTAVNDAPMNTVPGAQTTDEDTPLVFSAANGNAISMADIDAAANPFIGTVGCDNCIIEVTSVPGALIQWNNTNTVTISGTLAQVNAALSTVTFKPTGDLNGSFTFRVQADDRGSTGAPGTSLVDTDDIVITVREVNDAPAATNDANTTPEDTPLVFAAATLTTNDSAGPANESGQTLTVTGVSPTSAQGGTVTLVAGTITYTPAANYFGPDSFTYTVTDNGTTAGAADPRSAVGTVNVTVTDVNDAPVAADDANGTAEDTPLVFAASTLTTNDSAGPANESSQTLTVTAVSPASAQGGTVTLVGGTITYTPPANYNGPDSFTYTVSDDGTTNGASAPLTDTATVNLTVTAVNDVPVLTVAGAVTHTEGAAPTNLATAANITDVDDTNIESATIQISGNFAAGQDVLSFVNTATITGSFAGDTLTLTGSDTLANYAAALQAVQYVNTSDAPSTLQRTITWTVNDGAGNSNTQNTTLDITATNDAPINSVPAAQTVGEDTPLTFSTAGSNAITIADSDADPDDVQVTLNVANGTAALNPAAIAALTTLNGDGTNTVIATGTIAELNAALDGMTFTAVSNYTGAAAIQIVTDDLGNNPSGALSDVDSVAINVTAVNDAPVLAVTGAVTHTEAGAATNLATAANITDVDDTNIESATIQISGNFAAGQDVLSFADTATITGSFAGDTLTLTGTDTLANYIAALQAVQYTNTSDDPSVLQRTITWTVNDGDTASNTQTTTLDVTATNDAPVNTVPAGLATDEDTPLVINGASIADADAAADDVQITLNVTAGTVTLDATATAALTTLSGDGTATVIATGTVAEINAVLSGMTFTPTLDSNGTATIQMVTDDAGNNPSGALSDTDSFNITVNALNDAPVLTVSGSTTFSENGSPVTVATAVNITDVDDANIESATVTISANFQALDVLIFANTATITGNFAGDTLTLTGSDTKAAYIAALQSIEFSHGSDHPSTAQRTITWVVNDGDVNSNSQNTTVDVTASNDAPVNSVPATQATNEDTPLTLTGAALVSTSDADADPDDVQVTLNVTNGTVTLDATATGALTSLLGDGTNTVVANGTVAEINAALDGATFSPTLDFSGTASIQIVTNDLGNNPSGATSDTDSFDITVNALNDAPVLTVTGTPTFAENGAAVALAATVNITDVDDTNIESATITITNVQSGDVLNFVDTATITGNFAAGVLTLTGSDTEAAYIAALQSITFSNASDNPSITQRAVTWVVNDGDTNSNTQNTTVDVTATNDAPVNTVAAGLATNEDTPLVINGASIADPDADPDDVQVTLNVTSGTVALDPTATGALATLNNDGTATVVATGTVAEINAALSGMTFTPAADFNGTASIQMVTDDLGNNPSGAIQDTDSFNITVNAVNDQPSFTPGSDVNISEDHGLYTAAAWASSISAGPADENTQGLTMNSVVSGTTGTLTFAQAPSVNVVTGDLTFQANANTCGTATVDVTLTDDAGTPGVPADDLSGPTHVLTIMVACVNDAPSFTKGADQAVDEDAGAQTVNPWATAISPGAGETDTLTFNVSNNNNPLFTAGGQPAVSAAGVLTYTPAPNANGTTVVTVTLTDDGGTPGVPADDITTGPQTFNITVNAVNDAPSFSIAGDPAFVILGAGAQTVSAYATAIADGDPELTQVLTFNLAQTANSGTLTFSTAPAIDPATGDLTYTPTAGTHGTVTFDVTLSDDGSNIAPNVNVSAAQSFTIAVEKAPEVTTTTPVDGASGVSTSTNITVDFDEPVSVTLVPPTFKINCNAGADLAFAYVGATTNVTSVTLDPTDPMPAGNCVVTVLAAEVHDTDAYDPPDGLAVDYTFDFITNTPPTAVDDATTALGHVTHTVADASGVLGNDTDPDAGATLTVQNAGTPIVTTAGGTITFTAGGGYTYNAEALDQNLTDTVDYTVTDQFGGTDTGTLSINLGSRFIYVDDDHPTATPDGRDIHPWKTMQQAQANSAPNDTILVKSGSYNDHIVLQAGQSVIGQGIGANHTHVHNAVVFTVLTPGAAPAISRSVTVGDTITLSTNNVIRGVAIGSANGKGIVGSNFTAVTINDNVTVSANGNAALHLDTGAVTATFNSVSATAGANSGLIFNALTGTMNINGGTISNTAGATLNLTGGSMAGTIAANFSTTGSSLISVASRTANALTLSGALSGSGTIAASGNAAGTTLTFSGTQSLTTGGNVGVNLAANPGTISFTGGALQIATTNGNGFVASGATGNVNVTGANNTITTLSGIPLQMTGGVDIGASGVAFRSISANGAASGIVLALTGDNPFTLAGTGTPGTGGTLQNIVGAAVSLTTTNNVSLNHLTVSGAATGITGNSFGTLTLRDLAVTAVSGLSLNTGTVNNAAASTAFTSLNTSGGTNGVAMTSVDGTFSVGSGSLSGATGATFLVNGGNVTGSWNTTITQGNAAAAIDVSNVHTGSLTFPNTVTATTGSGLQFSNADGTYNFSGAALLSGGAGIDILAGSGGTFTWDGDSSIGNSTGELINIQTSAPDVTYSGAFSKNNTGRGIYLLNNTGGSFTINGTGTKSIIVTSAATHAVDLDNNDGMTMSFSGNNLTLTTQSGDAFRAVNGGTVDVTGTGNVITTTGGAAVNVAGTTIGGSHITFEKVTATGGASGIVLNNTGATGRLIITGTGGVCSSAGTCTGGAIQNTTSHGVSLTSTFHPSFTRLYINNTSGSGVHGNDVTNFTYEFGRIDNSGTGLAAEASNIAFNTQVATTENNLDGVVSIVNNTLTNAYYHGVDIYNHNGTITSATISNNVISSSTSTATSKGSGIRLVAFGSASTVASVNDATIDNNTISNFPSGAGIVAQGGNANSTGAAGTFGIPNNASNLIAITNNRIAGASAAVKMNAHAIQATVNGKGQGNFDISNNGTPANPIANVGGNVISHSSLGATTVTSTIVNNYITAGHTPDFGGPIGISVGSGVTAGITGSGALTTTIQGNNVSGTDGPGIQARSAEGTASMVIKIIGNTVGAPQGTGASYGIRVESGGTGVTAVDNNVCLEISGNTSAGEGGVAGIGLRKQGTVATTHDFGIEGLSPSPNTAASQVTTHVNSLNPGSAGGSELISAQTGFTSCNAP